MDGVGEKPRMSVCSEVDSENSFGFLSLRLKVLLSAAVKPVRQYPEKDPRKRSKAGN